MFWNNDKFVGSVIQHAAHKVGGMSRTAAAAPITVVSVVQSGSNLTWTFSSAVTLTGANVPELENDFDGTGSWQSPDACTQGSATSIIATYSGMPGELTPWRIASAPSNVSQSARITVPQSGTIT